MAISGNQTARPHYLLTALGIRPYSITYTLNGETATANYSPVALLQLLKPENRPDTVLCLLTKKAREQEISRKCSPPSRASTIPCAWAASASARLKTAATCPVTNILEVLHDPKHKEYDELREWVGGVFDLNAVNAVLQNLK